MLVSGIPTKMKFNASLYGKHLKQCRHVVSLDTRLLLGKLVKHPEASVYTVKKKKKGIAGCLDITIKPNLTFKDLLGNRGTFFPSFLREAVGQF